MYIEAINELLDKAMKPTANADRIRAMTDEELAQFIFRDPENLYMKTPKEIVDWLQCPAEEEEDAET